MNIKDGKKPLSAKATPNFITGDIFGNKLAIPEDIQAELDKKGYVGRWLNSKVLYSNQGYHPKGWKVYRRDKTTSDTMDFKFGNDPDGIIRRGDCILGYKPKEAHDLHKRYLEQQAAKSANINSQKAQEMRGMLRDSGLKKSQVIEGYEENE